MPHKTFLEYLEGQPEPWQQTLAQYLAPFQKHLDEVEARYQAAFDRYVPPVEYPTHGDFWQRYGHGIDQKAGHQEFLSRESRLVKEREKAQRDFRVAQNRHKTEVKRALRQKMPVPQEVLRDYPGFI